MSLEGCEVWGMLPWTLEQVGVKSWDFFGSISNEERSVVASKILKEMNRSSGREKVISVFGQSTSGQGVVGRVADHWGKFDNSSIEEVALFTPISSIQSIVEEVCMSTSGSVLFDISCLPKRMFFPALKFLMLNDKVTDLLVCYTVAARYAETLSSGPEKWLHLPGFASAKSSEEVEVLIVSLGFQLLGLRSVLEKEFSEKEVIVHYPFPPAVIDPRRSWEVLRQLDDSLRGARYELQRIDPRDCGECFSHLSELGSVRRLALAPFGPKPLSLAMALYAIKTGTPVFYTQPTRYAEEYSRGVSDCFGEAECWSYLVKQRGRAVY